MEGSAINKVAEIANFDLRGTTQNPGCYFDAEVSTSVFSLEDTDGASRVLFSESVVSDVSSTSTDSSFDSNDAPFSIPDKQQKEIQIEGYAVDIIGGSVDSDLTTFENTGCFFSSDSVGSSGQVLSEEVDDALSTSVSSDSSLDSCDIPVYAQYSTQKVRLPLDLKLNLVYCLKDIQAIDCSMQFCNLLIEAENSNFRDSELQPITEKFISNVKEVEHDIPKILFTILRLNKSEKSYQVESKCLASFFDLVKNPVFNDIIPSELLKNVSKSVKKLMELFCNQDLFYFYSGGLIEKPEKKLPLLKNLIHRFGSYESQRVFSQMYKIGCSGLDFSIEDKKEIESLLVCAAKYIGEYLRNVASYHGFRLCIYDLQLRSSVQFIFDLFPNLQTNEDFKNEVENGLNKMDGLIQNFLKVISIRPCQKSSRAGDGWREDVLRMPEHHRWWKDCAGCFKDNLIDIH